MASGIAVQALRVPDTITEPPALRDSRRISATLNFMQTVMRLRGW